MHRETVRQKKGAGLLGKRRKLRKQVRYLQ